MVQHIKQLNLRDLCNELVSVQDYNINSLYFQHPEPEPFFIPSINQYSEVNENQLAFQKFDFVMDRSEKEEEHHLNSQLEFSTFGEFSTKHKSTHKYDKNICRNVFKKTLRAFISIKYKDKSELICKKHNTQYEEAKKFCLYQIQKINGTSHMKIILVPTVDNEVELKKAILQFLEWFLNERYLRHLITEGRMNDKKAYILFKNKFIAKEIHRLKILAEEFERED